MKLTKMEQRRSKEMVKNGYSMDGVARAIIKRREWMFFVEVRNEVVNVVVNGKYDDK